LRYAEKSITLQAGDTICCYTDGVTAATDDQGNEFSDERLKKVLYESYGLSVEALGKRVMDNVAEFAGSADQFDDITCVVLRYLPPAQVENSNWIDSTSGRFSNQHQELEIMSEMVDLFCSRNELDPALVYQLTLVLDELMSNVIDYGFEDNEEHQIDINLNLGADQVKIIMRDDGIGFDPFDAPEPDLVSPLQDRPVGGLGLHFVWTIMDTVEYQRLGDENVLKLVKKLPGLG
jgi:sigma-B regulation protein RsbU (phosphoserine phosphatase)